MLKGWYCNGCRELYPPTVQPQGITILEPDYHTSLSPNVEKPVFLEDYTEFFCPTCYAIREGQLREHSG